jgi:hypothetical protein
MPPTRPEAGCFQIDFQAPFAITEAAEVALEDYARTVTRARTAEALRGDGPAGVRAVHLCGLAAPVPPALARDVEDFARSLLAGSGGGLGWS